MKSLFSSYASQTKEELFASLDSSEKGISQTEAARRLALYGPNKISSSQILLWKLFITQFKSSFVYLLIVASGLAFFFQEYMDGVLILSAVVVNVLLSFYQEFKAEKTAQLLKTYLVSYVKVRRNNEEIVVTHPEIVPGDIVILEPGTIVPADLRLIESHSLEIDESLLTGESQSVIKHTDNIQNEELPLHEALNIGFRGTKVLNGSGIGIVFGTGKKTIVSGIVKLATGNERRSSLAREISQFSSFILQFIGISLVILFVVHLIVKGHVINMSEFVKFYIALAISLIPEGLPVIITFALSQGAAKLAEHKVIVKRLLSIVNLGSLQILCTDKTGTLTENKLTINEIYHHIATKNIPFYGMIAYESSIGQSKGENPFDKGLSLFLTEEEKKDAQSYKRIHSIPFTSSRRMNSVIIEDNNTLHMISRGAPEPLIEKSININDQEKKEISDWLHKKAKKGARVMGIGQKVISSKDGWEGEEHSFQFLGMIAFIDPLKKTTIPAIRRAQDLGLTIKIITGDNKEVGRYIAHQIHPIDKEHLVMEGAEFDRLMPEDKLAIVEKVTVFARVSPEQKYQIVKLLQQKHEVGFIGDGMNDAPSLNIADTGIAVKQASDIAREAADIILTKKDLQIIVDGVIEGRKIFINISKYIKTTLASNFGNFFAIGCASMMINSLPLRPTQILLINILTDIPLIALATDTVHDDDVKGRIQYNVKKIGLVAIILGIVSALFDFLFFWFFKNERLEVLQTNWFIGSVLSEIAFVFSIRTNSFFLRAARPSKTIIAFSIGIAIITLWLPFTQFGAYALGFQQPTMHHLLIIHGIIFFYLFTTDAVKCILNRF